MPRKIKCHEIVERFLIDLNSIAPRSYSSVRNKLNQIATNVDLKRNVLVEYSFEEVTIVGKKTLSFSECRFIKVGKYVIVYTFSDKAPKLVFITGIYPTDKLPDFLQRYL